MPKISNWNKIGHLSWYNSKFQENRGRYLRVTATIRGMGFHTSKIGPSYVEVKDKGNISYKKLAGPFVTGIGATEEAIDYMKCHPYITQFVGSL